MGCSGSTISYDVFTGSKRGQMRLTATYDEDFLTHHLSNQASLSDYASTDAIRKRQIIEHMFIDQNNGRYQCDPAYAHTYNQFLIKSWIQRLFLEFVTQMDRDYFNNGFSYDDARKKMADRFLFELYQMVEFTHAAAFKIKNQIVKTLALSLKLSYVGFSSDSSLFPLLKKLKDKYPQVADTGKKQFPEVKDVKKDANLLSHFNSKCFSDIKNINLATTAHDLKFLFDTAYNQFNDFKTDMQDILGIDVLADVKVKCVDGNNGRTYNASSTRRVLIKWVETLLQRIPDAIYKRSFIYFIIAKGQIFDNFHVKSTIETPTTHNVVIDTLLSLIQQLKYNDKANKPEQAFGFFIYDLLRCKTHRKDGKGVVELIEKMKSTKVTKTGKKLEVLRIKNRFKTPNLDVMVNFKYGDIIVAEAQLGIDSSDVSEKDKKTNKFNHYLYQLERGLFGPTIQLLMQYEDFNRKDVIVNLKLESQIIPRTQLDKNFAEKTDQKCPVGHQMIQTIGNHFIFFQCFNSDQNASLTYCCDFCLTSDLKYLDSYYYCYKCSIVYCPNPNCLSNRKKLDPKKSIYTILSSIPEIKSKQDLQNLIKQNGYYVGVFVDEFSSVSELITDYLSYINCFMMNKASVSMKFGIIKATSGWGKDYSNEIDVTRYPTFVAFDRNCKPRKRMIGASLLHIQYFDDYAKQLNNPNFKCLNSMNCNVHTDTALKLVNTSNIENWKCMFCHNLSSIDSLAGFFKQVGKQMDNQQKAYQCPQPHQNESSFVCTSCAYLLSSDDNVTYLDVTGKSYLSTKPKKIKSKTCNNGHNVEYIHTNPFKSVKQICSDCNKMFIFSKQDGVGYCKQCNYIVDPKCMGVEIIQLSKQRVQTQLVTHFAQMTASQVMPCKRCCNRYTKLYDPKFPKEKQFSKNSDARAIEEFFSNFENPEWVCFQCKKQFSGHSLHLACNFRCQLQFCLDCSKRLFETQHQKQVVSEPAKFDCKSGHPLIKTTEFPDQQTLKFQCDQCKIFFTISSTNYWCKTCNVRYCNLCGPSLKPKNGCCLEGHPLSSRYNYISDYLQCSLNPNHIIHQTQQIGQTIQQTTIFACDICKYYTCDPNQCKQKIKQCDNNHNLKINRNTSLRHVCNGCYHLIHPIFYDCKLCTYDLCLKCYRGP